MVNIMNYIPVLEHIQILGDAGQQILNPKMCERHQFDPNNKSQNSTYIEKKKQVSGSTRG